MARTNLSAFIQIIILVASFAIFMSTPLITQAIKMSNAFYIIVLGNMNSISGEVTGGSSKLVFTSGELGAGLYTGPNYRLCAGFYGGIYCNLPASALFTFSVSPTSLDFGTIDPTSPVSRTNVLDVLSPASGYTVTAIENHSLRIATGSAAFIPDTTCDTGTCTTTTASPWTNTLTYGFGYRCDNVVQTDCIPFPTTYYKPFANQELIQSPQVVMQATSASTQDKQVQITYKVNVAGSQQPGVYTNTITYIATPNF